MRSTRWLRPAPYSPYRAFRTDLAVVRVLSGTCNITGCNPTGYICSPRYMPRLDRGPAGDRRAAGKVPELLGDELRRAYQGMHPGPTKEQESSLLWLHLV